MLWCYWSFHTFLFIVAIYFRNTNMYMLDTYTIDNRGFFNLKINLNTEVNCKIL